MINLATGLTLTPALLQAQHDWGLWKFVDAKRLVSPVWQHGNSPSAEGRLAQGQRRAPLRRCRAA